MSSTDDVPLEALTPWERPAFRADLALLAGSVAGAARQFAADAAVLARLAAQVPRSPGDGRGASPWISFRREVASARKVSDQAAATEIRQAIRLTTVLPHALHLLESGTMPVFRAKAFLDELEGFDDEIAGQLDADLADRAATVAPWRIRQDIRRAALKLDADVAARKTADATAARRVSMLPQPDGQASVFLTGPAVPTVRWYGALDEQARALKAAGDPRTLDQLRFDLAVNTLPCFAHPPADPTAYSGTSGSGAGAAAGLRRTGVEAASTDCRLGRPVQAMIVVPVETSLGLSNEPAWLDGYGWIDAPTSRLLLVDAELRRVCTQTSTGQLVDLADRDTRPPPTPHGVRDALLDMISGDLVMTDTGWRSEDQHDPSPLLRDYVTLRDRTCDGPTFTRTPARRADLDHDDPWPAGPTAAWNLIARGQRTHQLKHHGWTPLRTPTSTIWISPAGQTIEVPRHSGPAPGVDPDPTGPPTAPPDPDELLATDLDQTAPPSDDDLPPWLPTAERADRTRCTLIDGSEPPPF